MSIDASDDMTIFITFGLLFIFSYVGISFFRKIFNHREFIKKMIDKPTLNYKKYEDQLKSSIEYANKKIEEAQKKLSLLLEKPIKEFNKFRFNHYNSSVEKLLKDVEFDIIVLNLGFDYPKINNSNKIKDGTVEDYITYFEEFGS